VFLYKADVFGALTADEHIEFIKFLQGLMPSLEKATTGDQHIGFRYSRLLQNLWFPGTSRAMITQQQKPCTNDQWLDNYPHPVLEPSVLITPPSINPLTESTSTLTAASNQGCCCGGMLTPDTGVFGM
jgi:hypothetical protein